MKCLTPLVLLVRSGVVARGQLMQITWEPYDSQTTRKLRTPYGLGMGTEDSQIYDLLSVCHSTQSLADLGSGLWNRLLII